MIAPKITVVTSFSPQGYVQYGRRFLETFDQYWPRSDVELLVYHEGMRLNREGKVVNLNKEVPEFAEFMQNYGDKAEFQGKKPLDCAKWKDKWISAGYAFRWDAVKFCRKVFAIGHAAKLVTTGKLFWIDADVITFDTVPLKWLNNLLPDDKAICYLGRSEEYHSECGFVGYNLDHPDCMPFIDEFVNSYSSGAFANLREFHDSFVFDCIRKQLNPAEKNLMQSGHNRGHVWLYSPLAKYMDHLKGDNKIVGRSAINLRTNARTERYWTER